MLIRIRLILILAVISMKGKFEYLSKVVVSICTVFLMPSTIIIISNPQNMTFDISLICSSDISNAINVPRNDKNSFDLNDH